MNFVQLQSNGPVCLFTTTSGSKDVHCSKVSFLLWFRTILVPGEFLPFAHLPSPAGPDIKKVAVEHTVIRQVRTFHYVFNCNVCVSHVLFFTVLDTTLWLPKLKRPKPLRKRFEKLKISRQNYFYWAKTWLEFCKKRAPKKKLKWGRLLRKSSFEFGGVIFFLWGGISKSCFDSEWPGRNWAKRESTTHHPRPTTHHPPHCLEGGRSGLPIPARQNVLQFFLHVWGYFSRNWCWWKW